MIKLLTDTIRVSYDELMELAVKVMRKVGCDEEEAEAVALNVVEAEARGIHSHGVARLKRYSSHIQQGLIVPGRKPVTVYETPISAVWDGMHGVGQYISTKAMERAISKADMYGIGIVTVRDSNHFGFAGIYAEMAVKRDMIGIALSNTAPLCVPTFASEPLLGTNPIAVAIPTTGKYPFLLDIATAVISRGKVELYSRLGRKLPIGWIIDREGRDVVDPDLALQGLATQQALVLPVGGKGEELGGHKGYGLALLVELLTAGISLGSPSYDTYKERGKIAHTFMAIKLELFGQVEHVKAHFQDILDRIRNANRLPNADRIYVHGEKEYEERERAIKEGITIERNVLEMVKDMVKG